MKSKVISYVAYDQIDLSAYQKEFVLDKTALEKEMNFLKNKNAVWTEIETVEEGSIVICDLCSENPFFDRKNLKIMIGQNFFNKSLECLCIGMKKGELREFDVDGNKVTVKISSVQAKKASQVTDEMIKKLEIPNVDTVKEYEAYLILQQKKKIVSDEGYYAIEYVMKQVFEQSVFDLKKEDWNQMIQFELEKLQALADKENLNLRTMKPEDFEGKMPFNSYFELLAYLQNDSWNKVFNYLLGCIYAEEDDVKYTEETYEKDIKEYMTFWHESEENAKKINTYEYSKVSFYSGYFYKKVCTYVEENYFKEER